MEALSIEQTNALESIRTLLSCGLCTKIFDDPYCLDCKHNFCNVCINMHLQTGGIVCPVCKLPTCPSEVTRNQFLQSILTAWKQVENEIEQINSSNSTNRSNPTSQQDVQIHEEIVSNSNTQSIPSLSLPHENSCSLTQLESSIITTQEVEQFQHRISAQKDFIKNWENQQIETKESSGTNVNSKDSKDGKPVISVVELLTGRLTTKKANENTSGTNKRRRIIALAEFSSERSVNTDMDMGEDSLTQMPSTQFNSPDLLQEVTVNNRIKKSYSRQEKQARLSTTEKEAAEDSQSPEAMALTSTIHNKAENPNRLHACKDFQSAHPTGLDAKHCDEDGDMKANRVKSFVLVATDISKAEARDVYMACQSLGGRFGKQFDLIRNQETGERWTSVTHLITKSFDSTTPPVQNTQTTTHIRKGMNRNELRCRRTGKYMRALAEGTYIIDLRWVHDSLAAGYWLPEDPYEIQGDIYTDANGKPRESRLRRATTGLRNHIFQMFCFLLLNSEDTDSQSFQFNSICDITSHFNGRTITENEFKRKESSVRSNSRTLIGLVAKNVQPQQAKKYWQKYQIPIVFVTWVFDSISQLEVLPLDEYYPY